MIPFALPLEGDRGRPRERKVLMRGLMNVLATMSRIALDYAKSAKGAAFEGHTDGVKKAAEYMTVGAIVGTSALLLHLAGLSPMFSFLIPVLNYLTKLGDK